MGIHPAVSRGRRNKAAEHFGWFPPPQRLSRSIIELTGHRIQFGSCVDAEVGVLGEVLAEQPVAVLVAAALPRTVGITEEDGDLRVDGELGVLGHFFPLVPGERPAKLRRELG